MTAFEWSRKQIEKSLEYAERQLCDDITLEKMASEAGYSQYHYVRLFKRIAGTSPVEYVRKRRLTEAKKKLLKNRGILSTALEFGYSSQESFTYAFSTYFGLPPGSVVAASANPIGIEFLKKHHGGFLIMDRRKEWRMERISHQLFTLSQAWAHEATTLGPYGRGLHVVASETRRISQEIADAVELFRDGRSEYDFGPLQTIGTQLKLLTLNSIIEGVHSNHLIDGPSLAIADELRQIAEKMKELLDDESSLNVFPGVGDPSSVVLSEFAFVQFYIGGVRYIENLVFVKEFVSSQANVSKPNADSTLIVRGTKIPIRSAGKKLVDTDSDRQEFLIVEIPGGELAAVAVEPLHINSIFTCRLGTRDNRLEIDPKNLPVREQWAAVDGSVVRFVDWKNLK